MTAPKLTEAQRREWTVAETLAAANVQDGAFLAVGENNAKAVARLIRDGLLRVTVVQITEAGRKAVGK
jgi:hypothetical protein